MGERFVVQAPSAIEEALRDFIHAYKGRPMATISLHQWNLGLKAVCAKAEAALAKQDEEAGLARYRCTRCGRSEISARALGCVHGPCPMEEATTPETDTAREAGRTAPADASGRNPTPQAGADL